MYDVPPTTTIGPEIVIAAGNPAAGSPRYVENSRLEPSGEIRETNAPILPLRAGEIGSQRGKSQDVVEPVTVAEPDGSTLTAIVLCEPDPPRRVL
jgi:hypothetical protein